MTLDEKDDTKIDGEDSDGLDQLVKDGAEIETKPDDEKVDDAEDEKVDEDEGGDDELEARFTALESKLDEKDAEITFLRGEIAKRGRTEEKVDDKGGDEFSIDDIAKQLSAADGGKTAAKTIIDLATKIAEKKFESLRRETSTMLTSNQQVVAAKEADRQNVLNEFGEYLDDKDFADSMSEIFTRTNRAAGRYVPDSLYTAAATAKLLIDKKRALKNGTKNGVKEKKPNAPANPVDADTHDYSKVVTIDSLPATDREKLAMKGALKKMTGVTEKQYVENWKEANIQ